MFNLLHALGSIAPQKPEDQIQSLFGSGQTVPGSMLNGLFPLNEPGVYEGYNYSPLTGGNAVNPNFAGLDPFATSTGGYAADPMSVFALGGSADPQFAQRRLADAYEAYSREQEANQAMGATAQDAAINRTIAQAQAWADAPSPPSMMGLPSVQQGFAGIDSTLDGMRGIADQFRPRQAPLGQSPEYYAGLTSGGTAAQNDRFGRLWDQNALQASVASQLAQEMPGLFPASNAPGSIRQTSSNLGGAGMTYFGGGSPGMGAPSAQGPFVIDDAYIGQLAQQQAQDDAARFFQRYGREQTAGDFSDDALRVGSVKFSTPEQAQAFRASKAANEAERRQATYEWQNPLTIDQLDPYSRAQYMGLWDAQQTKNRQALGQLALEGRKVDADIADATARRDLAGKELAMRQEGMNADNQYRERRFTWEQEQAREQTKTKLQQLQREGRLTQKDLVDFLASDAAKEMGGPREAAGLLEEIGLQLPEGVSLGGSSGGSTYPTSLTSPIAPATPAVSPEDVLRDPYGNQQAFVNMLFPSKSKREELDAMKPQALRDWLKTNPRPGGGEWADAEMVALMKWANPDYYGMSPDNPGGWTGWGAASLVPAPMFYPLYMGGGAQADGPLERIFGEYGNVSRNIFGQPY